MMARVAILDYGCGNLASVANAVRKVGGEPYICLNLEEPADTHLMLPGQGAFRALDDGIKRQLNERRDAGQPILGICLGMQLMCEGSEEAPAIKGLGWLPYQCVKMPVRQLPHVGWNAVSLKNGLTQDYYFCHSYAIPAPNSHVAGVTEYQGYFFASAIMKEKLWAVQFHPERSGKAGLALLAEFLRL